MEKSSDKVYTAVVLDFETSGLDCSRCACTQLAMKTVRLDTWEVIATYNRFISPYCKQNIGASKRKVLRPKRELQNPQAELMDYEDAAMNYTAITMDMLREKGGGLAEVAKDALDFIAAGTISKGAQYKPFFLGQNIAFDIGFFQQMMNYAGLTKEFEKTVAGAQDFYGNFQPHYIDTITLARLALAGDRTMVSYKLELLCERLGIELSDAHDAEADVTATLNVALVLAGRMRTGAGAASPISTEKTRKHFKI